MQSKQCYHSQIESLRRQIARLEGRPVVGQASQFVPRLDKLESLSYGDIPAVSSGCPALDRALPQGGFRSGTLIEWLAAGEGTGATTLALQTAREACRSDGVLVVLDRRREFYPPAAARLGIDLHRLIVVQPATRADHHWAMDQALRSPAVAAVLAWPDADKTLDARTFRRWQLAVEPHGGLGLLVRPESARKEPSWADVRLLVEPLGRVREVGSGKSGYPLSGSVGGARKVRIVFLRCRGSEGRSMEVEIEEETDATSSVFVDSRLQIAN